MSFEQVKAIVLDFDGVIVESNEIKHQAMRKIFGHLKQFDEIMNYHMANPSVIRFQKFDYILGNILKIHGEDARKKKQHWSEQFASYTEQAIIECPEVVGASDFLSFFRGKKNLYLASATPSEVLHRILMSRSLLPFFRGVYGAPINKSETLQEIAEIEKISPQELLFIGDSLSDQLAAEKAGVQFYARRSEYEFADVRVKENLLEILTDLKQGNIL